MATNQGWNNGPEIQFVRDALAQMCTEAGASDNPVWWADRVIGDMEQKSVDSEFQDALAANIRSGALVTRIRADFNGAGITRYDAEIHQKMQNLLEDAFAHLKRL